MFQTKWSQGVPVVLDKQEKDDQSMEPEVLDNDELGYDEDTD